MAESLKTLQHKLWGGLLSYSRAYIILDNQEMEHLSFSMEHGQTLGGSPGLLRETKKGYRLSRTQYCSLLAILFSFEKL